MSQRCFFQMYLSLGLQGKSMSLYEVQQTCRVHKKKRRSEKRRSKKPYLVFSIVTRFNRDVIPLSLVPIEGLIVKITIGDSNIIKD